MLYKHSYIVKKKQHGQYFTHPLIANQIVREICESIISECFWKPWRSYGEMIDYPTIKDLLDNVLNLRFVDPAMGDGVFLIEVIRYFEEFLRELWDYTHLSSYLDLILTYFQQKLSLDFSLVGKRDLLTLDIWKFHIIRSMIYGVDLDPEIVKQTRDKILNKITTPEILELAKIAIHFNLRVGNSLISPIRMNIEAKENLFLCTTIIKTRWRIVL